MLSLSISDLSPLELQHYLQHAVAPRPICLASTINAKGQVNLSPFSFFNLFSTNPPICIFSPSRRLRDNTTKHTLENVMKIPECVINIVSYQMVQQMSLSSTEYPDGINEFKKAGFNMLKSDLVKPPRVAEAPIQLECSINQIIPLGFSHGAGNLVVAEVKKIHLQESILDKDGKIDQLKTDLVARLGGDWYSRIHNKNLFKVQKPLQSIGIGVDALPKKARDSEFLSGNDLGQLGNQQSLPSKEDIKTIHNHPIVLRIKNDSKLNPDEKTREKHLLAKAWIKAGKIKEALCLLH